MARLIGSIKHLTVEEAAAYLGTTATRVLMLLRNNVLAGVQIDGEWFVTGDSLACANAHGTDMKTVKGCASYCTSNGCGCK